MNVLPHGDNQKFQRIVYFLSNKITIIIRDQHTRHSFMTKSPENCRDWETWSRQISEINIWPSLVRINCYKSVILSQERSVVVWMKMLPVLTNYRLRSLVSVPLRFVSSFQLLEATPTAKSDLRSTGFLFVWYVVLLLTLATYCVVPAENSLELWKLGKLLGRARRSARLGYLNF